jgi:hypothetical protein
VVESVFSAVRIETLYKIRFVFEGLICFKQRGISSFRTEVYEKCTHLGCYYAASIVKLLIDVSGPVGPSSGIKRLYL